MSPAHDREEARRLYLEGSRHVEAGAWVLARSAYRRSFELYASPSTLVNLALCETELGNLAEAALLLERSLALSASTGPRFDRERQAAVQTERDRLHREIALSQAEASSPPPEPAAPSRPPRPETRDVAESAPLRAPPPSAARPYRVLGVGSLIAGGVAFHRARLGGVLLDPTRLEESLSHRGVSHDARAR